MTDKHRRGKKNVAALRRRLEYLDERRAAGSASTYAVAEAIALRWAIEVCEDAIRPDPVIGETERAILDAEKGA